MQSLSWTLRVAKDQIRSETPCLLKSSRMFKDRCAILPKFRGSEDEQNPIKSASSWLAFSSCIAVAVTLVVAAALSAVGVVFTCVAVAGKSANAAGALVLVTVEVEAFPKQEWRTNILNFFCYLYNTDRIQQRCRSTWPSIMRKPYEPYAKVSPNWNSFFWILYD